MTERDKKGKDRAVKQVSFSLTDTFEDDLLQFALEQGVFSKYVKRLIFLHKSGMLNEGTNIFKKEGYTVPIVSASNEITEKKEKNMTSLFNIN
jgi:hypothetical protein